MRNAKQMFHARKTATERAAGQMESSMEMKTKQYLAAANAALPMGWELRESLRMAASGAPTFCLFLRQEAAFRGTSHSWLVYADQPRHVLRKLADDVAARGLVALTDPEHGTYTSRVRWSCYVFETVGLRESLVDADPALRAVVDSIFYAARWALPDGQRAVYGKEDVPAEIPPGAVWLGYKPLAEVMASAEVAR